MGLSGPRQGDTTSKPLFSNHRLPMLITSLTDPTPAGAISTMRNAIYDGTDGFMLHMETLDPEHVCEADLARIMDYACDRPVFTLNHRRPKTGKTDEELISEQLMAVRAGASMIDMMGDMFGPAPMELAKDTRAVKRQQEVIDEVHALGGEVLMSSHIWVFMTAEETLAHARALEARGADFIKIAMCAHTEEEVLEVMSTTPLVKKELGVPFLHICMGQYGKVHRAISPMLGSCFALCVQAYTEAGHKEKPLLRAEKAIFDSIDRHPARNVYLGTRGKPREAAE